MNQTTVQLISPLTCRDSLERSDLSEVVPVLTVPSNILSLRKEPVMSLNVNTKVGSLFSLTSTLKYRTAR